jgi:hypothetical protein
MNRDPKKERLSLLSDLIRLAKADGEVQNIEFDLMLQMAIQLGVTTEEFKSLFEKYIDEVPPKLESDRIIQFHRLVLLMNVDEEAEIQEIEYIKHAGIKMGLNPLATNHILRIMYDYPKRIIPTQKLIEIFKLYHN